MVYFEKITISDFEVTGSGHYQKTNEGLIIESDDRNITSFFKKAIRNKERLGTIQFESDDSNSVHTGYFIVASVRKDTIELVKG